MQVIKMTVSKCIYLFLSAILISCMPCGCSGADNETLGNSGLESDGDNDSEEVPSLEWVGCEGEVDLDAVGARRFTMAPYLLNPTTTGVTIHWEAMDDAPSYILYGPKERGYTTCVCVYDPVKVPIDSDEIDEEHDGWLYSVTLEGLESRKRYLYTLVGAEVPIPDALIALAGGEFSYEPFLGAEFVTAPEPGALFTMLVIGDNQGLPYQHEKVVEAILRHPADMLLHTGDIVHNGLIEEYRRAYLLIETPVIRSIPHFHVAGNHEGEGEVIPFDTILPMADPAQPIDIGGEPVSPGARTGIVDYGHVRIFVLDTEYPLLHDTPQVLWLDAALEDTVKNHPEFTFLFGSWHRPTYSWADGRFGVGGAKEALHEVMTRWRVDLVLNGHNHCYERFEQDGVTYIVTGGAGAMLSPIYNREPEPGDNRIAAEMALHFTFGEIDSQKAEFKAVRAEDDYEIDRFSLDVQDRSDLR